MTSPPLGARPPARAAALAFLTASATLFVQVLGFALPSPARPLLPPEPAS